MSLVQCQSIRTDLFTPPWHYHDNACLLLMRNNGSNAMLKFYANLVLYSLKFFLQSCYGKFTSLIPSSI